MTPAIDQTTALPNQDPAGSDIKACAPQALRETMSQAHLEKKLREAVAQGVRPESAITHQDIEDYLNNPNYAIARNDYEKGLLTAEGTVAHALNSIVVSKAIDALRRKHPGLSEKEFQTTVLRKEYASLLRDLVTYSQLDLSHYEIKNGQINGYGKYLLYSFNNEHNPITFQTFVFSPKDLTNQVHQNQQTPLHPHVSPCASVVLAGQLEQITSEDLPSPDALLKSTFGTGIRPHSQLNDWLQSPVHNKRMDIVVKKENPGEPPQYSRIGREPLALGDNRGFNEYQLNIAHILKCTGSKGVLEVRVPEHRLPDNPLALRITSTRYTITTHYYEQMDGAKHETPAAAALRHTPQSLAGKTNVAEIRQL